MKNLVRIFAVFVVATSLSSAQIVRTWASVGIVNVPSAGSGGQAGGASNPANVAQLAVDFEDAIATGHVAIKVYLAHGRVGDLTMSLSHCGTTVTLFSGSANQLASVNGDYTFIDYVPTSFPTAVDQASGPLPAGFYKPSQPLSAFIGKNSAGPWVLTVVDLAAGITGTAGFMDVTVDAGVNFGNGLIQPLMIPDGSAGVCLTPVTHVVNAPGSAQVGMMSVALDLTHPFVSDLTILLSHAGVTATLISPPTSGADLSGIYTFEDWAPASFAQTATATPGAVVITPGHYRPRTPLTVFQGLDQAGPWYLTICDQGGQDVGWLDGAFFTIAPGSWNLQISQPNGPASVTIANSGGAMDHSYANMMTLVPGAFPFGWLYGLDMSLLEISSEVATGPPFFGALDDCGSSTVVVPGPVPSGITVYVTVLEIDASGSIVNFKPAFAYTTP